MTSLVTGEREETEPAPYRELLLGCGHSREKRLWIPNDPSKLKDASYREWKDLTTLDNNPLAKPDIVFDLDSVQDWPFDSDTFDEVHAYEVIEHLGQLGNDRAFFSFFSHVWAILKPGGYLMATTPSRYSPWLWGDPGHRRAVLPESLVFLDQTEYAKQLGHSPMSDYRHLYKADFHRVISQDDKSTHRFILQAVKPSRISV